MPIVQLDNHLVSMGCPRQGSPPGPGVCVNLDQNWPELLAGHVHKVPPTHTGHHDATVGSEPSANLGQGTTQEAFVFRRVALFRAYAEDSPLR
eukprot:3761118-Alexandrium_andersonii.AAC.1